MIDNKNVKINYKELGIRIHQKRIERGFTQEELSERVNISPKYLSNIEANNVKSVGLRTLIAIADSLDTTLDYLLFDSFRNNKNLANNEIKKMLGEMTRQQRSFAMESIKMILNNKDNFK